MNLFLHSLSLTFLVAAILINLLLAIFIYKENPKSTTNKIFGWLGVLMSVWLGVMYIAPNPNFSSVSLWAVRLTLFFATPMDLAFFLLAFTIPAEKLPLKKRSLEIILALSLLAMLVAISPYTFTGLNNTKPVPGIGLPFSGGFNCFLVIGAIYVLAKKIKSAADLERQQLRFVMLGIIFMFGLVITTIFLPVLFFQSDSFVPLTPIYTLFFLIITAYAIVKHHLFNLKIIATEALITALGIMLFALIFVQEGIPQKIVTGIILATVLLLGKFLVSSVKKEVAQREEMEIITGELAIANEKLKTLDQARAEFISIASHQLRTPPATIKWYLSSVLSGDYGAVSPELSAILKKTEQTNNHLISLIEDMLNVSRIERGKMEFLFEPANLEELARFAYEQLLPIAHDKKLLLTYEPPAEPLPPVTVDKEKIRQVMNNLIDNALKYTKAGTVKVKISKAGETIRFEVRDSGKGIGREDRESIFHKYTRGKESIKQSAGLGLGLYVAKIIIEQHKGKIWAESPGEGKGSTFAFTLPISNKLEATSIDLGKTN